MQIKIGHAVSTGAMRSLVEVETPSDHHEVLERKASPVPKGSVRPAHVGLKDESSDDVENRTVDIDEHPATVELDQADTPGVLKEHTVALTDEPASISTKVAGVDAFQPGQVIRDRYVIEELIGEGGFATVYRARDLRRDAADGFDVHIALKVLRPELRGGQQAIARLKREFRQTHGLSHPNIVRVFDLDAHDNAWFIVMELLKGETLAAQLRRLKGGTMPITETLALLAACVDALEFAHQRNITHGDFKPANVFVLQEGGVRIIDFGGSSELRGCASGNPSDQIGRIATPAYASPQVLARTMAVPSDDLFSFACVAFEMLAGTHPFAQRSYSEVRARNGAVAEPVALSPRQMAVLKQGLAWRREDRLDSIRAFFLSLASGDLTNIESQAKFADLQKDVGLFAAEATAAPDAHPAPIASAATGTQPVSTPLLTNIPGVAPNANIARVSLPVAVPDSTLPIRSGSLVLPAAIDKTAARISPCRSPDALQPNPTPRLPVILPSRHLRFFGWLMLFVFLYLGFLLLRNHEAERISTEPVQSKTPQVVFVQAADTLSAVEPPGRALQARPVSQPPAAAPMALVSPVSAVSFDVSNMTVTEHAVTAAIILKRVKGSSGRLQVAWRIKEESAQAGRDFNGPMSGTAEFADLQQIRTLFVPLLNDVERRGDRTFVVELTAISKNAAIAPYRNVSVTIMDVG